MNQSSTSVPRDSELIIVSSLPLRKLALMLSLRLCRPTIIVCNQHKSTNI